MSKICRHQKWQRREIPNTLSPVKQWLNWQKQVDFWKLWESNKKCTPPRGSFFLNEEGSCWISGKVFWNFNWTASVSPCPPQRGAPRGQHGPPAEGAAPGFPALVAPEGLTQRQPLFHCLRPLPGMAQRPGDICPEYLKPHVVSEATWSKACLTWRATDTLECQEGREEILRRTRLWKASSHPRDSRSPQTCAGLDTWGDCELQLCLRLRLPERRWLWPLWTASLSSKGVRQHTASLQTPGEVWLVGFFDFGSRHLRKSLPNHPSTTNVMEHRRQWPYTTKSTVLTKNI